MSVSLDTILSNPMFSGVGGFVAGILIGFLIGYLIAYFRHYWKHRHAIATFGSR